jgi:hypothetical protein
MTHSIQHFGKAMTAIAAVLAFTSNPSFAQDTTAPPDPVADTSVQTPDPLAAEPAAEAPATTSTAVPPAPKPKVEAATATTQRATPRASRSTARPTTQRTSRAAPAATAAAPAAQTAAPTPPPVEPPPPAAIEPAAPPVTEPAPASDTLNTLPSDLLSDEMLPVTGAVALGLIALAGAAMAMRRRKRRREKEEFEVRQQALDTIETEAEPEPVLELAPAAEVRPEPAIARVPAPIHDPVPDRNAPVTKLPNGFDISRFGRHVQAAYRGPTPDNPSLSLKYRVRRAAALDQQERRLAEQGVSGRASEAPAKIPAQGNWGSRSDADFMFRRAGKDVKQPVEHN